MGRTWRRWLGGMSLVFMLAACTTTGRSFNADAMRHFVPGQTTLEQAREWIGEPVALYQQPGGPTMARWARRDSAVADALYLTRELWLDFDAQGRYLRVANRINVRVPEQEPRSTNVGGTNQTEPWAAPIPVSSGASSIPVTVTEPARPVSAAVSMPVTDLPVYGPTGPLEANVMQRGTTPPLSLSP